MTFDGSPYVPSDLPAAPTGTFTQEGTVPMRVVSSAHVLPLHVLAAFQRQSLAPYPVHVEKSGREFVATFREAKISISGRTAKEAKDLLEEHVESLYALYRSEPHLGAGPLRQLKVMEKYLGEGWQSLYATGSGANIP